jgi:hypothetical protein
MCLHNRPNKKPGQEHAHDVSRLGSNSTTYWTIQSREECTTHVCGASKGQIVFYRLAFAGFAAGFAGLATGLIGLFAVTLGKHGVI